MKKALTLVIALAMMLSLSINAFAADTVDNFGIPDEAWNATITGMTGYSGDFGLNTVSADGTDSGTVSELVRNPLTGLHFTLDADLKPTTIVDSYKAVRKIKTAKFDPNATTDKLTLTFETDKWLTYDNDGDKAAADAAATDTEPAKTAPVPVPASLVTTYEDYLMYANGGYHAAKVSTAGGTTVGVMALKDTQVSFTVPLYMTLAVVGDGVNGTVYTPASTAYKITNTSNNANIAVTGLKTETSGTVDWSLKKADKLTAGKDISLLLNSNQLLTDDDTTTTDITENDLQYTQLAAGTLSAETGDFFVKDKVKNQYTPILKTASMGLTMTGKVTDNWAKTAAAADQQATAQWKITYTVSQCDTDGNLIKAFTYAGGNENYKMENGQYTEQGAFKKTE